MASYADRLHDRILIKGTPVVVGIDPRWDLLPEAVQIASAGSSGTIQERTASAFETFGKLLIDVVAPLVPAVKPQVAFFEQLGVAGCRALHAVMRYARQAGLIVIADAKRGDIGSTAEAYADAWLAGEDPEAAAWPADALTVNPWLGRDSLEPFVSCARSRGAGVYVLVRTSNPGAADFQDRPTSDGPLFECVAQVVRELAAAECGSHQYGPVGAVVGATWPDQLKTLRQQLPRVPLLIPGYGSQGSSASQCAAAFDDAGLGALINNSRAINFAWLHKPWSDQFDAHHWQDAVQAATRAMIADLALHTSASQLRPAGSRTPS